MNLRLAAIALGAVAILGCSPSQGDPVAGSTGRTPGAAPAQPETHPESGLAVIPLSVSNGKQVHRFRVELAQSRFEQAKGLMFRTAMGPDEGMLFPLDPHRQASFWMRNTVIPLDIVFIGEDRRILNIEAEAVPYSEDQRRSEGVAAAVLELNGGRAAELGIGPGDRVDWKLAAP